MNEPPSAESTIFKTSKHTKCTSYLSQLQRNVILTISIFSGGETRHQVISERHETDPDKLLTTTDNSSTKSRKLTSN